MVKVNLIIVTGPTASGKTSFAAHLARFLDSEIISADSRQVYRDMNIGTGKDYEDYFVDGVQIPYHLIDIKDAGYKYNIYEYQQDFIDAFKQITERSKIPILAGGTGLYIDAVTKGYKLVKVPTNIHLRVGLEKKELPELVSMLKSLKPELHNTTDTTNKKRTIRAIEIAIYNESHEITDHYFPKIKPLIFGIKYDRESRRRRITERLHERIHTGMIEEVENLLEKVEAEDLIFYGLEYKFTTKHLTGELSREEMIRKLEIAIHQFAKRQMTWFRKMEKEGAKIYWMDGHMSMEQKIHRAKTILNNYGIEIN